MARLPFEPNPDYERFNPDCAFGHKRFNPDWLNSKPLQSGLTWFDEIQFGSGCDLALNPNILALEHQIQNRHLMNADTTS